MVEKKIPRAGSPEEVGVSSKALAAWLADMNEQALETHSIMVIRHGKVAYEQFRAPYTPEVPHVMFSVSKSVTSCAIGFAVEEGLLALDDLAADHVPELRDGERDENLEALTIHHLLNMTSGKEVSIIADKTKKRWIKDYAEAKWGYKPGEGWNYSNESIYMLCVILSRVSGVSVVDYLMPRLFEPLGIPRPFWENDGYGVEAGGWGLYMTTESFAKFILCYTQGGVFEGEQVIPAQWVAASLSKQSQQGENPEDEHGTQGYGYCFWKNIVENSFRADGVFSQMGYIFSDYDACIVQTAGEVFSRNTLDTIFRHYPAIFEPEADSVPAEIPLLPPYQLLAEGPRNATLEENLEGRFIYFPNSLQQLPRTFGFPVSMMPMAVFFMSADKAGNIDKVRFRFQESTLKFSWSEGSERNTVLCGMDGRARKCLITLGGVPFTVACSAAWDEQDKLHVWIRPLNSVAERRLSFVFKGRQVRMQLRSVPSLSTLGVYAAPHALKMIPNPVLARFLAGNIDKLVSLVEPLHFGFLR